MNKTIENKYLLDYIAKTPELSGWHLRTTDVSQTYGVNGWRKSLFELCHTSFSGESIPVATVCNTESQSELAKALRGELSRPHVPEDELMLNS